MENGGKKIKRIKLYKCGYCVNNIKHIMKGTKSKKIKFPALVVFIEHQKYGNILFDTGYSQNIYNNGVISKIYNMLNKTYVEEKNIIKNKLQADKINNIDKIILSHTHPDHIGGLRLFENYELIATEDTIKLLNKSKIRDLVFKNMLPDSDRYTIKNVKCSNNENFLKKYFNEVYDIFGDSSIIGVRLDGHSKGQMGIYIPEYKILFAADGSWGNDFVDDVGKMKLIPQLIQNNFKEYKNTIENIKKFKEDYPEIKVIFSHEQFEEIEYD